jgi:hypothetical protein
MLLIASIAVALSGAQSSVPVREPLLTPAQIAEHVRTLAREYRSVGLIPDDPSFMRGLAIEIVRLNSTPERIFRQVGRELDKATEQDYVRTGELGDMAMEESIVCRLWFLLRYRPHNADSVRVFGRYHQNIPAPLEWEAPGTVYRYDYPWCRQGGVWTIERFSVRSAGGVQGFDTMYREFSKLPRRRDSAWKVQ